MRKIKAVYTGNLEGMKKFADVLSNEGYSVKNRSPGWPFYFSRDGVYAGKTLNCRSG